MTLNDALARWLQAAAPQTSLVVARAPEGLLAEAQPDGWTVWTARSDLAFRLAWARRDPTSRHLVIRAASDVWLTDLEYHARAEGGLLTLTPRQLLAVAVPGLEWPAWLDGEPELVADRFRALSRAGRGLEAGSSMHAVSLAVARVVLGFEPQGQAEPVVVWRALAERAALLAGLAERRCPLVEQLRGWLASQPEPLCWLNPADPGPAVRLTWLVALLWPHLPHLRAELPRLYPNAERLEQADPSGVLRVALGLAQADRRLAAAQQQVAETTLLGPLRGGLVRRLGLDTPAAAQALLAREQRCGPLALMALRVLLEALANGKLEAPERLERDLEALLGRRLAFSASRAVTLHARLLLTLLRCERRCRRLARAPQEPAALLSWALAEFDHGELGSLNSDVASARRLLGRNALADPSWRPKIDARRHKALLAALWLRLETAGEAAATFARALAQARLSQVSSDQEVWTELLAPLLDEPGRPKLTVLLVAGLPWQAWPETLSGSWQAAADCRAEPRLAPVPAGADQALRAVALGPGSHEGEPWLQALRRARPEQSWRRAAVPRSLAPLADQGCVGAALGADHLKLVFVNLLAGEGGAVSPALWRERLARLSAGVVGLARGRADQAVAVLGVSGAVECRSAPGLGLPGTALTARCVAAEGERPEQVLSLGHEGRQWWAAVGQERLAPAAAGRTMADGGLSTEELVVPWIQLYPVPAGDHRVVLVGNLSAPEEVVAGQPAEVSLTLTLRAGALVEVVDAQLLEPRGEPPVSVTLDRDEPRRVTLSAVPTLAAGLEQGECVVEVEVRAGPRIYRRRASMLVRRPATVQAVDRGADGMGQDGDDDST